jgi:hypothetical protein
VLLEVERRRHRRNARYRWLYGAVLAGYAVLIVVLGVGVDAGLALTPIAGVATSLAAAFVLSVVDRQLIAPGLERWVRHQNIRLLKDDLITVANTIANIRRNQVEIDVAASDTGVHRVPLLSPTLLEFGSARAIIP